MQLDIRLPIGLLFTALGLLLAGFGAFSDKSIYQRSGGWNVNLAWGAVLLVFGIVMIILGRQKKRHSSGVPSGGASGSHGH
jgi:hypothetical protein